MRYNSNQEAAPMLLPVKLTASLTRDDETDSWVAHCPELDVASQGRDPEHAHRALNGALLMYLSYCERQGILRAVMEERQLLKAASPEPYTGVEFRGDDLTSLATFSFFDRGLSD